MKEFLKKVLPDSVVDILRFFRKLPGNVHKSYLIKTQPYLHRRALKRIRQEKAPVNVLFFALYASVWKYDRLYWLMENDPDFNPTVVICPVVNRGREHMLETLRDCYRNFEQRGYRVVCAYDEKNDTYLNARSLAPDIIFYTNPYQGLIDNRYYITKFRDVLTCYVNYAYNTCTFDWLCSLPFHNLLWAYFSEEERIKRLAAGYSPIKARNQVVSGYPMYDGFVTRDSDCRDWKRPDDTVMKRVIWAPHHDLDNPAGASFLKYAELMKTLATRYKEKVQFVFKPHPLLKSRLYGMPEWGSARTDAYYDFWANGENTACVNGDYVDLFLSSDAMIHDCGSFTVEYLYTCKPVMYLPSPGYEERLNEVGADAYGCHYLARCEADIENFLEEVVLNGQDTMEEKRRNFYRQSLVPPNGRLASENIFEYVRKAVIRQK